MAEQLTPQQKQAVQDRGGKLLVSAAAGSGKTKVLVDRLMGYLTDPQDPANINDFLMITYTKAAAAELRGKIASKLSERIAQEPDNRHLQQQLQRLYLTQISTVHAFCGEILRVYAYRLDIPGDFRVADENECAEIRTAVVNRVLDRAYDTAQEHPDFCAFVDSQGLGRDDRQVPEIILKVFDSAHCHLNPQSWLEKCLDLITVNGARDVSETLFGQELIRRFHRWLDLQITQMENCVTLAGETEGMEKPAALLGDTLLQLQNLRKRETWDEILEGKEIDFGTLRFSKEFRDSDIAEKIKAARDNCKKGLAKQLRVFSDPSCKVLADLRECASAARGLIDLVKQFAAEYDRAKRSRRILDFGDLEHKMLDLLLGKSRTNLSAAALEIGERFREIMVDEYQDSNEVQDAIYSALSTKKQNLFMVGDVKQSIYQFRLADPGIFLQKYSDYVPADLANPGQGRKVVLSRNFRSGGGVLAAANDVFRTCMTPEVGGLFYGPDEALYEGLDHIPLDGPETELYCIDVQEDTYAEEASFVADKIRHMLDSGASVRQGETLRPVRPEDIVILLRSPNSCGGDFLQALERLGIRCATGGGTDLLQTEEIAALRCLLQAVQNPRVDIPLIGAMANPVFGFTADDLAKIRSCHRQGNFYEALQRYNSEKSQHFLHVLTQLRTASRKYSLTGLLEEIILRTGMDHIFAAMPGGALRAANLQTFFQLAAEFESGGNGDLGRFLEYLENMEDKGLITVSDQSAPGAVSIMSIHKSKGLEFPVVFLCGLGREFNMESQRAHVLCHKELGLGLSVVDGAKRIRYPSISKRAIAAQIGAESLSEEMRVLYVAMTRAKDRLIMTYASNRLEKDLTEMVNRMDLGGREMLVREAVCHGEWVLLTALQRTEAGELFQLGGYPARTWPGEPAWHIRVVRAPELECKATEQVSGRQLPAETLEQLRAALAFHYPYQAATDAPSKQTATQRKGRIKDAEVAEDTMEHISDVRRWRSPGFAESSPAGKDYGNATHAVMQYLDYAACGDLTGVEKEVERLLREGYISPEQAKLVDRRRISAFFLSEIGWKLRSGTPFVREFKFSILEDGSAYDTSLTGEKVLLQGVVDCALLEEDGITVLDFKTDYVTDETVASVAERYRLQVEAYSDAMAKIYQKPVKKALLYFFRLDRFVEI